MKKLLFLPACLLILAASAQENDTWFSQPLDTLVNDLEKLILSNSDSTLSLVGDVVTRARQEEKPLTEIKTRRIQVAAMWQQGEYELALDSIAATMALVETYKSSQPSQSDTLAMLGTTILNEKGRLLGRLGRHKEAIKAYQTIIDHYNSRTPSPYIQKRLAMMKVNMAISYKHLGTSLDTVMMMYDEALVIFKELGDPYYIAGMCLNMGIAYHQKGEYRKGLTLYLEGLEMSKKHDLVFQSNLYLSIISIYKSFKDYNKAIDYGMEALQYLEKSNSLPMKAFVLLTIGSCFSDLEMYDSSAYYLQQSLAISSEQKDQLNEAEVYHQMANNQIKLENYQKALDYANKGIAAMEGGVDETLSLQLTLKKATCLKELGQTSQALKLIQNTLREQDRKANNELKRSTNKIAHEIYSSVGDYPNAYKYLNQYMVYQDSVLSEEKTLDIARIEYDFQLKAETERLELEKKQQAELYEKELERDRIILQAGVVAGILGIIILIILYRSNQYKKRKNKELSEKNTQLADKNTEISNLREKERQMAEETLALKERELTTVTMLSHERNSLLQQLGNQIGGLSDKVDEEVIPDLKEIKKTIKSNLSEKSWSNFMYQFEKVHPDFFNKLKSTFPNITQNDLRLCAYLKVGMDNKEIANISNVTAGSVKKSINRLKKKMELNPEDDLREFIMKVSAS